MPGTRRPSDESAPPRTTEDELASAQTLAASNQPAVGTDVQPPTGLPVREDGRYDLREELGRGGMGRVSLALDRSLGREVALKELLAEPTVGASIGEVARFVREARVTGRLEHPGIVPVLVAREAP